MFTLIMQVKLLMFIHGINPLSMDWLERNSALTNL